MISWLTIKPLPAKAGRFLLRLKVIYFKPQNRRTRNPGPDLVYPDLTIGGQTWCSNTSKYKPKGCRARAGRRISK